MKKFRQRRLEQRAAADVVRMLSGSMSDSDVKQIRNACRDKDYEAIWCQALLADACVEALRDDPLLTSMADFEGEGMRSAMSDENSQQRASQPWRWVAMAACLVVTVAMSFLMISNNIVREDGLVERYVTKVGEQKTLTLNDGSVITLNTSSQILVDVGGDQRIVTLDRGEAFFNVAPDPERPFSVDLDGRMVTALGTGFNIVRSAEGFTLSVLDGVVAVHKESESASIKSAEVSVAVGEEVPLAGDIQRRFKAGMAVRFSVEDQSLVAFRPENIEREVDWMSGVLRFENVPFNEVILQLNRYSAKKIVIGDASVMDLKVVGSIKVDDISGGLRMLAKVLPIKVAHEFDQVLIHAR